MTGLLILSIVDSPNGDGLVGLQDMVRMRRVQMRQTAFSRALISHPVYFLLIANEF